MVIHTWGFPQTPVIRPPRPVYVEKIVCVTGGQAGKSFDVYIFSR